MGRRTTLNEDKGRQISDLEALIITMGKLIEDKLEQKPNAGITIAKGKPNERKYRYSEALRDLRVLEGYFGIRGCMSLGVCQTCSSLNINSSATDAFGVCRKSGGKAVHVWDSCDQHSKKGGGYGL